MTPTPVPDDRLLSSFFQRIMVLHSLCDAVITGAFGFILPWILLPVFLYEMRLAPAATIWIPVLLPLAAVVAGRIDRLSRTPPFAGAAWKSLYGTGFVVCGTIFIILTVRPAPVLTGTLACIALIGSGGTTSLRPEIWLELTVRSESVQRSFMRRIWIGTTAALIAGGSVRTILQLFPGQRGWGLLWLISGVLISTTWLLHAALSRRMVHPPGYAVADLAPGRLYFIEALKESAQPLRMLLLMTVFSAPFPAWLTLSTPLTLAVLGRPAWYAGYWVTLLCAGQLCGLACARILRAASGQTAGLIAARICMLAALLPAWLTSSPAATAAAYFCAGMGMGLDAVVLPQALRRCVPQTFRFSYFAFVQRFSLLATVSGCALLAVVWLFSAGTLIPAALLTAGSLCCAAVAAGLSGRSTADPYLSGGNPAYQDSIPGQ